MVRAWKGESVTGNFLREALVAGGFTHICHPIKSVVYHLFSIIQEKLLTNGNPGDKVEQ